jgi:hypothetical protein
LVEIENAVAGFAIHRARNQHHPDSNPINLVRF